MRILVVDDEPHILRDLGHELKLGNHEVYTASTIQDTKSTIDNHDLDIAIIDLKLDFKTGYGGIEVYHHIKNNSQKTKIILLSAYRFEDFVQQLKEDINDDDEVKAVINEIEPNYVYKGGQKNYINAVLEKIGIENKGA